MPGDVHGPIRSGFPHLGLSAGFLQLCLLAAFAVSCAALATVQALWGGGQGTNLFFRGIFYFGVLEAAVLVMALFVRPFAMASQLFGVAMATLIYIILFGTGFMALQGRPREFLGWLADAVIPLEVSSSLQRHFFYLDYLFREVVSAIWLVGFPFLVFAVAFAFHLSTRKGKAGADRRILPSVNNATFADGAGWAALVFPAGLLILLVLLQQAESQWVTGYLPSFPWFLPVAPVLYLGLAAQRRPADPLGDFRARLAAEQPETIRVRPLYDRLHHDAPALAAELCGHDWRPPHDKGEDRDALRRSDVEALLGGALLKHTGNLDAELLHTASDAVKRIQDRGQATIFLCPDGSGKRIFDHFRRVSGFDFPDLVRKIELWDTTGGHERQIDPYKSLDVVIAEQTAFLDIVRTYAGTVRGEFLDGLLSRTGLIVALDFHAVDASLLLLTLESLGGRLPKRVGFLVQMRWRQSMDSQIIGIKARIALRGAPHVPAVQTQPPPVEVGWVWFFSSDAVRKALLELLGYPGTVTRDYRTAAYFALVPQRDALQADRLPIFILQKANEPPLFDALQTRMRAMRMFGARLIRSHDVGSIYVPRDDVRICVVCDYGNVFDCLGPDYAFWGNGPDYLTIIVSEGYPGRGYLREQHKRFREESEIVEELLCPIAQEPGIGITDMANRLMELLSRPDGLSAAEVGRILNIASGKISSYLGVSATRRGLSTLFRLIDPGQPRRIEMTLDAEQNTTFRLQRSGRETLAEPELWVRQEGGSEQIARVPLADEGLLFCEDGTFRFGSHRVAVTRVAAGEGAVYGRLLNSSMAADAAALRPDAQHFFDRDYEILVREDGKDEGGRDSFVGETAANLREGGGLILHCGHIHAGIRRTSTQFLSISTDMEPTPVLPIQPNRLRNLVRRRRPFRSIAILAFEDREGKFYADPVLHATLAASLQVVLGLSFPALRERIAVVPIKGAPHPSRADNAVFRCLFPSGRIDGLDVGDIFKRLYDKEGKTADHHSDLDNPLLSLAVIEDAAHDLGVVRRICQDIDPVLARWRFFLDWAAREAEWKVAGLLDAESAAAFPGLAAGKKGAHG